MMRPRVLVVGLDGYEPSLGEALMAEGRLPHLARLRDRSARFQLDHESGKRTGLAWEHVSLGQSPDASRRWAAVHFDPMTYAVAKEDTFRVPFVADLDVRAVIFDAPYFDLARAPNCRGTVRWGAHDAGVAAQSAPASVADEIRARFGDYPATRFIYGQVWNDAARARAMAEALVGAVDKRTAVFDWLVGDRFADWDLAMVVVSEFHSAIEALWHGVDPRHPLHTAPSAAAARDGVLGVYHAADRMIGALCARYPDARVMLFSMHGMGANDSDVATMLLLPELLYRARFGVPLFEARADWATAARGLPWLAPHEDWARAVNGCLPALAGSRDALVTRGLRRLGLAAPRPRPASLEWMPAARYQPFWSEMDAFALPSFYDGRVRLNLAGRERVGRISISDYEATCAATADLVTACRNPRTNEPVAVAIERPVQDDPLAAAPTQADLIVTWRGAPLAFEHPRLGMVGPAPYRRTGGHSGGYGIAYVADADGRDFGVRSAFDVVPTIIELLGVLQPAHISGRSLLREHGSADATGT